MKVDHPDGGAAQSTCRIERPDDYVGTHAPDFLRFETPCGTGTMTHPSVVHAPEGFGGYPYWMAATPYDGVDDTIENPCVYCSPDGTSWMIPPGASNPVAAKPPGAAYNSDADLALDGDTLHLWYRRTDDGFDTILHASSTDGRSWSEFDTAARVPQHLERKLSPTVVEHDGRWIMYTVRFVRTCDLKVVQRREAEGPAGPWGPPSDCVVDLPPGRLPWHIEVCRSGSQFWMIVADSTSNKGGDLFLAVSEDGVEFTVARKPLLPRHSPLGSGLYRSALVPRPPCRTGVDAGVVADVWYSIVDGRRWGLARGELRRRPHN